MLWCLEKKSCQVSRGNFSAFNTVACLFGEEQNEYKMSISSFLTRYSLELLLHPNSSSLFTCQVLLWKTVNLRDTSTYFSLIGWLITCMQDLCVLLHWFASMFFSKFNARLVTSGKLYLTMLWWFEQEMLNASRFGQTK